MRTSRLLLLIALATWLAACGGTPGIDSSAGDQQDTTTAPTNDAEEAEVATPEEVEGRRYELDGMTVWSRSALEQLPEQATIVRFTSTIIDSGQGLELCLGAVATSLPPQCGGPVIEGLNPDGWTETVEGVTWGSRTVTVEWPPVEDRLTLISDEPPRSPLPIGDEPPDGLPAECEDIPNIVHRDTVSFYAADNPDRTAGGRSVNNGAVVVLAVVEEHLEDVRAELTTADAEPCLEPVTYSQNELSAAQDRLAAEELYLPAGPVLGSGSGNAFNRLTIDIAVADRQTIETIAAIFDDPGMLYITGSAEILDGTP